MPNTPTLLNVTTNLAAYADTTASSNPRRKYFDWNVSRQGLAAANPRSDAFLVPASGSLLIFNGSRTLAIDGTTAFGVTLSPLDPSRYRFTATAGTLPAFRTDRALALNGITITIVQNTNGSITMTCPAGPPNFGAVVMGDIVFIPGVSTGDVAGPFSLLNEGYWTVLSTSSTSMNLARATGEIASSAAGAQTLTSSIQLQAFAPTGVLVGDKLEISLSFSTASRKIYTILAVNPKWVEVTSTPPVPLETGILPTAAGFSIYSSGKQWVHIETDQEIAVQANGSTDQTQRVTPLVPGDASNMGAYDKFGAMWSLTVVNRTTSDCNIVVLSVE